MVHAYKNNWFKTIYSSEIPLPKGSSYILNDASETTNSSKVLSYDSKVTGTIEYKGKTVPNN